MRLYKKLLRRLENGEPVYDNEQLAKDLEQIAEDHYKKELESKYNEGYTDGRIEERY